jgi:hypothetical protein
MRITLESTEKLVTLLIDDAEVPARIWQGATDTGIPVQCYITRLAPEIDQHDPRQAAFQRELKEHAPPRPTVREIPLRMIL